MRGKSHKHSLLGSAASDSLPIPAKLSQKQRSRADWTTGQAPLRISNRDRVASPVQPLIIVFWLHHNVHHSALLFFTSFLQVNGNKFCKCECLFWGLYILILKCLTFFSVQLQKYRILWKSKILLEAGCPRFSLCNDNSRRPCFTLDQIHSPLKPFMLLMKEYQQKNIISNFFWGLFMCPWKMGYISDQAGWPRTVVFRGCLSVDELSTGLHNSVGIFWVSSSVAEGVSSSHQVRLSTKVT